MGERVSFRPLGRADFNLLRRWRAAQHVTPWFGPPPDREQLNSYYERYLDGTAARAGHICLVDGRAVGFVESYRAEDHRQYFANMQVDEPGAVGMDVFIGETDALERGLGSRIIRDFVAHVLFMDEGAQSCFVAPDTRNPRSVRAFERAGFVRLRTIQVRVTTRPLSCSDARVGRR